jgi:hypothetical protein
MSKNETPTPYFERFYPEAKIEPAEFSILPRLAQYHLEEQKNRAPNQEWRALYQVRYPDNTLDAAAVISRPEVKEGDAKADAATLILVFNLNQDSDVIGEARSFSNHSIKDNLLFSNQPYVSWTQTKVGETRRGLATKRLHLLNHFCLELLDVPLRSSMIIGNEAFDLWVKLYKQGLAEIFVNQPGIGMVFRLLR